jgi:hypothetical protein
MKSETQLAGALGIIEAARYALSLAIRAQAMDYETSDRITAELDKLVPFIERQARHSASELKLIFAKMTSVLELVEGFRDLLPSAELQKLEDGKAHYMARPKVSPTK